MTTDLSAGLDTGFEFFAGERPVDPRVRDSATLWIMDCGGEIAFPRVSFDAIGEDWDTPWVQLNFVDRTGRTLRLWSQEPGYQASDAQGRQAIRGAGPLRFQCIEPFRRWTIEFEGHAFTSTTTRQMAGEPDGASVDLAFRFEAEMAAPPWLMGGMTAAAARSIKAGDAGALMGGVRYEQLCRIKGSARIDGEDHAIDGTGMRVRRQGVRNMGAAMGHCQHSALFPSGRAFGAIVIAPGPEGPEAFNEAFLIGTDRRRIPARIVQAPWMTRLVEKGGDASLVLDSAEGTVRIAGEVLASLFDHHLFEMAETSVLHQGTARYIWDGEEAIGLIERCTLKGRIGA
jgi:hypothetical protein